MISIKSEVSFILFPLLYLQFTNKNLQVRFTLPLDTAFTLVFNYEANKEEVANRQISSSHEGQLELLSPLRGLGEAPARVRAFILTEAEYIMSMVTIIVQQTYFDGYPRDNQLWALQARMQVLLDKMRHLQEEYEIDCTIAYDMWRNC
ncbi:hypothetical protein N7519_001537 [Penicillium mononematosum]|uniref:uncharacterized protein n=1 Tax=Penicillium mononematosum TaxID=268346 RepID=UPI0025471ECC|nr:uncharacterized protein N7519_001537 [Penicillium mononematosum]KAJ6191516.1 hypothetical protein N7519_001537 [Penicillium mononematosum]